MTGSYLNVTESAQEKIKDLINARRDGELAVRVTANGQYPGQDLRTELRFIKPSDFLPEDIVLSFDGFQIRMDTVTANTIQGATIDFDKNIYTAGFNIEYPPGVNLHSTARHTEWNTPVENSIQEAIDDRINPALAGHGGFVQLVKVQGDSAFIQLGGGCQGCAMSQMTLKNSVEGMIKQAVPQILHVIDVTEHTSGNDPYYSSSDHPDA